jgi:NAD+ synthase (glutamine-hydrolysing)
MMPSAYTRSISLDDAREMAKIVGVRYSEIPLAPMVASYLSALADEFKGTAPDAAEENIQARIRGTLLMALSNKFGSIVLTTGNKSEMAVATRRSTATWPGLRRAQGTSARRSSIGCAAIATRSAA